MSQSAPNVDAGVPPVAEARKEHQWLLKLVGEWTYEYSVPAHGEHPAQKATGTENVRPWAESGSWPRGRARRPAAARTPA